MSPSLTCPCGRQDARGRVLGYAACCGPFHTAAQVPETAEQLMRSRYSAFVLGLADYLSDTWHPSTRPPSLTLDSGVKWLGLAVRAHEVMADDRAEVEFVARSRIGGRGQRLHERSRFVREGGRWYYVDGDIR